MKWLVALAAAILLLGGRTGVAAEGLMDGRRLLAYCEESERQGPKANPFREAAALARDLSSSTAT